MILPIQMGDFGVAQAVGVTTEVPRVSETEVADP